MLSHSSSRLVLETVSELPTMVLQVNVVLQMLACGFGCHFTGEVNDNQKYVVQTCYSPTGKY